MRRLILVASLLGSSCVPALTSNAPTAVIPPTYTEMVESIVDNQPDNMFLLIGDRFVYAQFEDYDCPNLHPDGSCHAHNYNGKNDVLYSVSVHGKDFMDFRNDLESEVTIVDKGENGYGGIDLIVYDHGEKSVVVDQVMPQQEEDANVLLYELTSLIYHNYSSEHWVMEDLESIPFDIETSIDKIKYKE